MKALSYVDHTAGNAKRTESGVETLQCVKVVNFISITKCFLLTNNMASKNYLLDGNYQMPRSNIICYFNLDY